MKIKICGLTDVSEVAFLKENNVDFAGMVLFFEKSKRNISCKNAGPIVDELKACGIKSVAVTVCPNKEQIDEIIETGFDYLQVHGEISDDLIENCKIPVLKAFNVKDLDKYEHYLELENIKGFVFDAGEPGSGKTFDWNMLKELRISKEKLFMLAGGLDSSNVLRAIKTLNPDGVDVSSSVELYEDKPGKDPVKIKQFCDKARL